MYVSIAFEAEFKPGTTVTDVNEAIKPLLHDLEIKDVLERGYGCELLHEAGIAQSLTLDVPTVFMSVDLVGHIDTAMQLLSPMMREASALHLKLSDEASTADFAHRYYAGPPDQVSKLVVRDAVRSAIDTISDARHLMSEIRSSDIERELREELARRLGSSSSRAKRPAHR